MSNLSGIVKQLKKERDRVERELSGLNAALAAFVNVYAGSKPKRKVSARSRAKMAAAQRARWAKRASGKAKPKRTMSASARRKIAAAQRARWAKVMAQQRKAA
jgi:hypothetical protein